MSDDDRTWIDPTKWHANPAYGVMKFAGFEASRNKWRRLRVSGVKWEFTNDTGAVLRDMILNP